jgi:ubiquinone/menaquinone biosynthesis C-methylase UbiE
MNAKSHWERIYSTKSSSSLSWYQEHANLSLRLIRNTNLSSSAFIIDVGGGTSPLVDDLLRSGYTNLTVLDLSATALATARLRLGAGAEKVRRNVARPKESSCRWRISHSEPLIGRN